MIISIWVALKVGPNGFDNLDLFDHKNPLLSLRISRVFLSALVGAALASSGCALQALLQNPLADPYIIGVSGGSAIGGTLALVFLNHAFLFAVPLLSMTGAFFTTLMLAYFFRKNQHTATVLLAGIAINAFAGAFITMVKIIAPFEKTQALLYWLVGNLNYVSWDVLGFIALCVGVGVFILISNMGSLHFMSMGEEEAIRLGVDSKQVKRWSYLAISLMVGVTVAFCGMIGFVGLVVPQLLRLYIGCELRILLPASTLLGAILLVVADALSRFAFTYLSTEIPVGALTALIGAPVFAWALFRYRTS